MADVTDSDMDRLLAELEQFRQDEREKLKQALTDRNDTETQLLQIVLLFHLQVERLLDRIIVAELRRGATLLKKGRLTFAQKTQLVRSFGLIEKASVLRSVDKLNSVRNGCVHKWDKLVTLEDVEAIGKPLGEPFDRIREGREGKPLELTFLTCDALHQLLVGAVFFAEHPAAKPFRNVDV